MQKQTAMASAYPHIFVFLLILWSQNHNAVESSSRPPKALLIPISKDDSTLQYIAQLSIGTPLKPKNFVLDLGGKYLWMDCENGYNSSTYKPGHCGSAACSFAKAHDCFYCYSTPPRPGCSTNTCALRPENTIRKVTSQEELATDTVSLPSTDGSKARASVEVQNLIFSCARTQLLDGLASGAKGMAGLGRTSTGLWNLFSSAFGGSLPQKFALCLTATSKARGVLFFGKGPYLFYENANKSMLHDVASFFRYTSVKLYTNPVSAANASTEYYISVKSISINQHITVPLNTTLLSINKQGYGGTRLSTISPYTVLESSIYKAFTETFDNEIGIAAKVAPVAPFTKCYSTEVLIRVPVLGLSVPSVSFVFDEAKDVYWIMYGFSTMVDVGNNTACLAFIDGGPNAKTAIVIGAHQMQNHLIEFDLAASKIGISSTLRWYDSECSNFNF